MHEPVLFHVTTTKGKGYPPAEQNPTYFHGVGSFEIETGNGVSAQEKPLTYTEVFGKTLSELEEILVPKGFLRINRSVIINRAYVHNYSFWEYDKFILRMKDEAITEFIVSRDRMKQIKGQLAHTP